jgi:hypothetical protein
MDANKKANLKHIDQMIVSKIHGNITVLEIMGLIATQYSEIIKRVTIQNKES